MCENNRRKGQFYLFFSGYILQNPHFFRLGAKFKFSPACGMRMVLPRMLAHAQWHPVWGRTRQPFAPTECHTHQE